jgi:hypothetical protein
MAKKSRRSSSRKIKHTRKHKTHHKARRTLHRRRTHRRRGGADALNGASVNYHLSGSWPSRMSLGQGADYFKYHEGQHGGAALGMGPFPAAVLSPGLPQELRGPAHIGGIDKAINDVKGLSDTPDNVVVRPTSSVGGKRRKHRKSHRKSHKRSKSHKRAHSKKHRRHSKRRGGSLGYAPFPSTGMLLSSPKAYAQAGLNPEWKTDVAFTDAKIRETQ